LEEIKKSSYEETRWSNRQKDDVKDLIQSCLDRNGTKMKEFSDNRPGDSWYYNFVSRNSQLNIRFSENIKRSRAGVSPEIIISYFDELAITLEGVPPQNIINYDETCFTDDPGRKVVSCSSAVM
jgi:hypothetical protein